MTDLVLNHRNDPRRSLWYEQTCTRIAEDGPQELQGWIVRRPDDVERFLLEYFLPIVDSIERDGYRTDLTEDIGYALIGEGGELLKSKQATHRFFIARALGSVDFPVRITAVHQSWWRSAIGDHDDRRPPRDWQERLEASIGSLPAALPPSGPSLPQ